MSLNQQEYKDFYDRVGQLNGWDFSKIKCSSEGVAWNFYEEVATRCRKSDVWLDIGTGGGEAVLPIAGLVLLMVGVDQSGSMVRTANANLRESNITNARFFHMEADKLQFPETFFNVISCRHSKFSAKEAARVLALEGIFLTQQVSEHDKFNMKKAFGRGQSWGIQDGTLQNKCIAELSEAGFRDIQTFEYDAADYYEIYEDLVFLLKHTPIIPNFGQVEKDFALLDRFIEENRTDKGIMTNSKRFMVIARLP